MISNQWVLGRNPSGFPQPADFTLQEVRIPDLEAGEVLVANHFLSVDVGVRDRLSRDSYSPRTAPGEVIDGFAVGEVIESTHPRLEVGDRVASGTGWRTHYKSDGKGLLRLDPEIFTEDVPESTAIGVLGVSGLTAYFGLLNVARIWPGQTVLVSSAAGTVGATAGQIARINGCRVVGVAGGPERCAYVRGKLGFDDCLDRLDPDLASALGKVCPEGVDVYFDNVGGELLDLALLHMNRNGRVTIAGQVSEYNRTEPRGVRHLRETVERRLRIEGFVVWDFLSEFKPAMKTMASWIKEGRLVYTETVTPGFASAPVAFCELFTHAGLGRSLVRL